MMLSRTQTRRLESMRHAWKPTCLSQNAHFYERGWNKAKETARDYLRVRSANLTRMNDTSIKPHSRPLTARCEALRTPHFVDVETREDKHPCPYKLHVHCRAVSLRPQNVSAGSTCVGVPTLPCALGSHGILSGASLAPFSHWADLCQAPAVACSEIISSQLRDSCYRIDD